MSRHETQECAGHHHGTPPSTRGRARGRHRDGHRWFHHVRPRHVFTIHVHRWHRDDFPRRRGNHQWIAKLGIVDHHSRAAAE